MFLIFSRFLLHFVKLAFISVCASRCLFGDSDLFYGSNPKTLKQIVGTNKVNSNTIEFLKESNIYKRALKKTKKNVTNIIQALRTYLEKNWSLNPVIRSLRRVIKSNFSLDLVPCKQ